MRLLLAAILSLISFQSLANDACRDQIPASLVTALTKKFPAYRTPLVTDNSADDIESNIKQGGTGCLSVGIADFDGDTIKDFILGLTARTGDGALVVAAVARGKSWKLVKLSTWSDRRARLFVDTAAAGTYELSEALDAPGSNDTSPLHCSNAVAVAGQTESWSVVYCYGKKQWRQVQNSD